jgi:hypothetical protein
MTHLARIVTTLTLSLAAVSSLLGETVPALDPTQRIDQEISQHWADFQLKPSPRATDGEWCRRVFLDVIGRIPSVSELIAFTKDRSPKKRERLVKSLLYDERYKPEYARYWSTVWTNHLVGRKGGSERNSFVNRAGLEKYLRDAFAENRKYDQLVYELVTAEGENSPGTENFNGAVNFLSMKLRDKATLAASETARLFLGKQVQCTQCHDHPFNQWKQNQFWEFNAFFRQAVVLRRFDAEGMVRFVELTDQDFAGEGNTAEEAEIYYELRNAKLQAAYPAFINGEPLANRSGYLADVHRRQELGRLMLGSEELPRAIVNRMWGHFFGYGFTTPVDDMGPHNHPTHPQLLSFLAQALRDNSYDLKLLMEWIILSEPYGLSSRMTKTNRADDPTKGEPPMFSHFYIRQMRAEELYESLLVATGAAAHQGTVERREQLKNEWLKQFVLAFGTDEGDEATTFDGTITQTLMMFNGELMKQALSDKPGSLLVKLAKSNAGFSRKVDHLYLAALARKPTRDELRAAEQLVQLQGGKTIDALQDLWWALLNSNEFIFNH